jgi:histidinol dehydrogenase
MLAGPSEIMIVADATANPAFIAADLLSQAEHDPSSKSFLVTTSRELINDVELKLEEQLRDLPRRETAERSLKEQGGAVLVDSLNEAWEIVNMAAPEHLEILLEEPQRYIDRARNAGSIFLGPYSPEPLGDYWAGTNHVLPTGRAARFSSPLGVNDFMKYSQVISYAREELQNAASCIENFARVEGLEAHARSVEIRGKEDGAKR